MAAMKKFQSAKKPFDPAGDALDRTDNVMAGKENPGFKRYAGKLKVKKAKPVSKYRGAMSGLIGAMNKGVQ